MLVLPNFWYFITVYVVSYLHGLSPISYHINVRTYLQVLITLSVFLYNIKIAKVTMKQFTHLKRY